MIGESATSRSAGTRWSGMLVLGDDMVAYRGPASSAAKHRHDATQLVVSLDSPFRIVVGERALEARAAIVPSRVEHSFEAACDELIVVLVEPTGTWGGLVDSFAREHAGIEITDRLGDLSSPGLSDARSLSAWSRRLLEHLIGASAPRAITGVRPEVLATLTYVDDYLDEVPRLAEAAVRVGLSARQLSRSFAGEVGMPFRRYVLWSRIRRAVLGVREGHDLTTAAATAGFADSAHFSRVFRALFGLAPSDVLPLLDVTEPTLGS